MKLQAHLIRISRTIIEDRHVVSIHSFFERIHAPTSAEALMIARQRHPNYSVELFDERLFVANAADVLRELVSC